MNNKTPIFLKKGALIAVLLLVFCLGTGSVYASKNKIPSLYLGYVFHHPSHAPDGGRCKRGNV